MIYELMDIVDLVSITTQRLSLYEDEAIFERFI